MRPTRNRSAARAPNWPASRRARVRRETLVDGVRLAVSEAVTNVVRHAYPLDPGEIRVRALVGEDVLEVVVSDDGCGVHRDGADDGGLGFGLALICEVSDQMTLAPRSDGGTDVRMRFSLLEVGLRRRGRPALTSRRRPSRAASSDVADRNSRIERPTARLALGQPLRAEHDQDREQDQQQVHRLQDVVGDHAASVPGDQAAVEPGGERVRPRVSGRLIGDRRGPRSRPGIVGPW